VRRENPLLLKVVAEVGQMVEEINYELQRQKLCEQFCGKRSKAELDKIMEKFLDFCKICPTYDEMRQIIAWAVSNGARFDV
jgi:hypothetical protein